MINFSRLSWYKTLAFLILVLGPLIILYVYTLAPAKGESKNITILKHVIYSIVLVGSINILVSTTDRDLKVMLLVIIIALVNLYNINFSLRQCTSVLSIYKLKLYLRSTIIIILLSIAIAYSNFNDTKDVFSFLYADDKPDKGDTGTHITFRDDKLPKYCPSMDEMNKPTDSDKWDTLSTPKQKNCTMTFNSIQRRTEITL